LYLERLRFLDGCYDTGGAYWGAPANIYCAWGENAVDDYQIRVFVRAESRLDARNQIRELLPKVTFLPMKTWEARISTGDTNEGQVGLCFSVRLESAEEPSEAAVLEAARDALMNMDQMELDGSYPEVTGVMLYTNADKMTTADIMDVSEVESEDEEEEETA
jgi:hypothetical protein